MSDTAFFTIHCSACRGGVEFPAHGIGHRITCPHCGVELQLTFPSTPEHDPAWYLTQYLDSVGFPRGEEQLRALSRFVVPNTPSALLHQHGESALGHEEAMQLIDRFVAEGLLEESRDLAILLQTESSAALKALAKSRKVSTSGNKETLARRLAKADPAAMHERFAGTCYLICTAKGALLVEQWRAVCDWRKMSAERQCIQALIQRDFTKACVAFAWQGSQQCAAAEHDGQIEAQVDSFDIKILHHIWDANLRRHSAFAAEVVESLRVAASMMHLSGSNNPGPWLSNIAHQSSADWLVESRTLLFYAFEKARLEGFKSTGATEVQVLGSGSASDCDVCLSDAGRVYCIDEVPVLPHEYCSCGDGCRCVLIATR